MSIDRLCTKSSCPENSLCNLCVLCVSVVCFCSEFINHRDTENTEVAQRELRTRTRRCRRLLHSISPHRYSRDVAVSILAPPGHKCVPTPSPVTEQKSRESGRRERRTAESRLQGRRLARVAQR